MLEMHAEPVIKVAVEPKTKADQQKMSEALVTLVAEDPSFRLLRDEETGQTIIEGMGELKEGITELFRAGEVLRRAKEDKRRRRVAGECADAAAKAAAWRRMTAVSHTASTAEEYNEYQGMMWGNAMVAHWFLMTYGKTTGRKYYPTTCVIYVLCISAYLRPRYDVCFNSPQ